MSLTTGKLGRVGIARQCCWCYWVGSAHPAKLIYDTMNRHHPRLRLPIPLLARFLFIVCAVVVCGGASKPNVILIYTDDHAQWAVGSYGNKDVHTPHMDRLAIDGMRFT